MRQALWLPSMNVFGPLVFELEGRASSMCLSPYNVWLGHSSLLLTYTGCRLRGLHVVQSLGLCFSRPAEPSFAGVCRPPSELCMLTGQPTACSSVNVFSHPVDVHRYRRLTAAETAVRTRVCTKQIVWPELCCAALLPPCVYHSEVVRAITYGLPNIICWI